MVFTWRGIESINYHHFLPLGRFPQPDSALANFAPFAVIIIATQPRPLEEGREERSI